MNVTFKMTHHLYSAMQQDLLRPHRFAAERVGFISCRVGGLCDEGIIILAHNYHPVADSDYLDDPTVGAMMGAAAIRKALQFAYQNPVSMFHVHMHEHSGRPYFSHTDLTENAKFVPDFWHVRPTMPHGALLLSADSSTGLCWYPGQGMPVLITTIILVGAPLKEIRDGKDIRPAKLLRP